MAGDRTNGVISFQDALALMKQVANEVDKLPLSQTVVAADMSKILRPAKQLVSGKALLEAGQEQDETGYLYDLLFRLEVSDSELLDDMQVALYSGTLLFNLATCFHIEGSLQGKSKMLQRASQLYQMSMQLIEEPLEQNPSGVSLVAMVLLNNKATCHFDLCDYEGSRLFSSQLKSLIRHLGTNNQIEEEVSYPEGIVDALLFNSTFMGEHSPTAAQAA